MADFDDMRFQFLYIELYSMGADWYYPESRIPYNMLRYIVKGSAKFTINGEDITVKENDIVYIPNGCNLTCCSLENRFEFYSVRFISTVFCNSDDILEKYYNIPRVLQADGEEIYFKEMYHWVKSNHISKKCFVRGYLNLLIGSLSYRGNSNIYDYHKKKKEYNDLERIMMREQKCLVSDSRVRIVTDYIVLHPEEKYNPEKLSEMVGLSKQRFGSLFKKQTGKAPMEYVKEVKLTTAARKLLVETDSVNEIAYSVGYEDPNYFIREFKKAFGYTPNKYRIAAKES